MLVALCGALPCANESGHTQFFVMLMLFNKWDDIRLKTKRLVVTNSSSAKRLQLHYKYKYKLRTTGIEKGCVGFHAITWVARTRPRELLLEQAASCSSSA